MSKRYRLSEEELELVLAGLLIIVNGASDPDFSDDALLLAQRLAQRRPGRPGGQWSDDTHKLWDRASKRARAMRR